MIRHFSAKILNNIILYYQKRTRTFLKIISLAESERDFIRKSPQLWELKEHFMLMHYSNLLLSFKQGKNFFK
jgi:hypothetical protein